MGALPPPPAFDHAASTQQYTHTHSSALCRQQARRCTLSACVRPCCLHRATSHTATSHTSCALLHVLTAARSARCDAHSHYHSAQPHAVLAHSHVAHSHHAPLAQPHRTQPHCTLHAHCHKCAQPPRCARTQPHRTVTTHCLQAASHTSCALPRLCPPQC